MKILFLDIDGVLNSDSYDRRRDLSILSNIDESRLPLLKSIVDETSAKIVLTSSWRKHWNSDENLCDESGIYITNTFAKFGLKIYDKIPDLGYNKRREEVKAWLARTTEPIESYVILDDNAFFWEELYEHLVKTNPRFGSGLEKEHCEKAIEILNK
jgi:hypothetical protein